MNFCNTKNEGLHIVTTDTIIENCQAKKEVTYGTRQQLEFRHIMVKFTNQHQVVYVYFKPLKH